MTNSLIDSKMILLLVQYLFAFGLTYFGYRRLVPEKFSTASKIKFSLSVVFSFSVTLFATAAHFNLLK